MRRIGSPVFLLAVLVTGLVSAEDPDYLHMNKVIDKLERGNVVTGIWVRTLHPRNGMALVEYNGYPSYEESVTKPMIDFILIGMEHAPFDVAQLRDFFLSINSRRAFQAKGNLQPNIATLVRIPEDGDQPVHASIKQVLDVGAHGVVVPHVTSADDARKIVRACRYPSPAGRTVGGPSGQRGASPDIAAFIWGLASPEYVDRADVWPLNPKGDILVVLMIEDKKGVANIEEILDVPGVGAIMFGPYDYSFSIGHPGDKGHPKVAQAQKTVKKACDERGIPLIGLANTDNIHQFLAEDYRMLTIGSDSRLDGAGLPEIIAVLNERRD